MNASDYFAAWWSSFVFTQIVEIPIYLRGLEGPRGRAFAIAFGASALTHPLVWYVFPFWWPGSYAAMVSAAEVFAWLAEAVYLRLWAVPARRAIFLSLAANSASFLLSLLSRRLFGSP